MKFFIKDVFFNNGLVNLYNHLIDRDLGVDIKLNNQFSEIDFKQQQEDKIFYKILEIFLKDFKIVHQTDNDRWYFDEKKGDFILDKKFDIKGKSSGNDILSGVYTYKSIEELGFSNRDEVRELYFEFCNRHNLKPEKNVPNRQNRLVVAITHNDAVKKFSSYLVKGDILDLDSKIHQFENGSKNFRDMLPNKTDKIDKWEALIYWFGVKIGRYYNSSFFIYPNSMDLNSLQLFKEDLKIYEDVYEYRDKNDKLKKTSSNIDFYVQLEKDGIKNPNFYISKSQEEFELKFFIYLASKIIHIEEHYKQGSKRRRAIKERLYKALQNITFLIYSEDGDFKSSLQEYSKAYRLIKFLELLKNSELFEYLGSLITNIALCKGNKEVNLIIRDFSNNILEFQPLGKEYYLASFNILKNGSRNLGKRLYEFENLYLEKILKGKNMNLHQKSKILGDGVGNFSANLADKDLLFRLRNIKNHKQLISYFKDLEFRVLKDGDKARLTKEFHSSLQDILEELEKSKESWEIVRDYIAIYAIEKFKATEYFNKKGDK